MKTFFNALINQICRFMREEDGLSTVEYAVAGGVIAAAVVTAFGGLSTAVGNKITSITGAIN